MQNPWKTIKTNKIYKNPFTEFYEDIVIHPNGDEGVFAYSKPTKDAVGMVATNSEEEILLIKEYKYLANKEIWTIPFGAVDDDDIKKSARIELEEEAGYTTEKVDYLGKVHYGASRYGVCHICSCDNIRIMVKSKREIDEKEVVTQVKFFPRQEIEEMIEKGVIDVGFVITSLYKYFLSKK